jgi:hypothetical protein
MSKLPITLESTSTRNQTRTYGPKPIRGYDKGALIKATVRFDDQCGNGHNSFSITADVYIPGRRDIEAGGCMHDEIAKAFPELAPFIKWHLSSTDGPMHYVANTKYNASNRDHNGLLVGESRQIKNGKSGLPCWELVAVDPDGETIPTYELPKYMDAQECPSSEFSLVWRPWCRVGEGKARQLDAARDSAVWPEATDEELIAPGLEGRLLARLPALLEAFRADVESLGFVW